jgi:hypothetical protein
MHLFVRKFENLGKAFGVLARRSKIMATLLTLLMNGCLFDRKSELDHPNVCGFVYERGNEKTIIGALVRVHFCFERNSPSGDRLAVRTDSAGYFYLESKNCMGNFQIEINISKDGYDTLDQITTRDVSGLLDDCLNHDYYLSKK